MAHCSYSNVVEATKHNLPQKRVEIFYNKTPSQDGTDLFLGQNVSFKVENIIKYHHMDILQKFTSQTNVMREPKRDK